LNGKARELKIILTSKAQGADDRLKFQAFSIYNTKKQQLPGFIIIFGNVMQACANEHY